MTLTNEQILNIINTYNIVSYNKIFYDDSAYTITLKKFNGSKYYIIVYFNTKNNDDNCNHILIRTDSNENIDDISIPKELHLEIMYIIQKRYDQFRKQEINNMLNEKSDDGFDELMKDEFPVKAIKK